MQKKTKFLRKDFLNAPRGITLIALVVTIIVLLILAGVALSLVAGGNGILGKAANSAEKYGESATNEQNEMNNVVDIMDNWGAYDFSQNNPTPEPTLPENTEDTEPGTEVKPEPEWTGEGGVSYVRATDGSVVRTVAAVSNVYAVSDGEGNTIPVPNGFYYVGGTLGSGVVISDNEADKNAYAGEENVPSGVAYNSDGTVNSSSSTIVGNQFVWIPCTASEYQKYDWGYANASWDSTTNGIEYNQIDKYGGFYIGRYEAGVGSVELSSNVDFAAKNSASGWQNSSFTVKSNTYTGKVSSKPGQIPYYHSDYYTAIEMSNNMYINNSVRSGLITGTMWDVMLKFIAEGDNSVVSTNSYWGNYNAANSNVNYTAGQGRYATVNSSNGAMTSAFTASDSSYHYGIRTCGSTEDVKKKNLYDVAGNLWEWTTENMCYSDNLLRFALRGGSFDNAYASYAACYRGTSFATDAGTNHGFRVALYIK